MSDPEVFKSRACAGVMALWPDAKISEVELLPAHASPRRYVRLHIAGRADSVIAMVLPDAARAPEEKGSTLVELVRDEPFVVVSEWLSGLDLPVPELFGLDEESRTIILEDLGSDELLVAWQSASEAERQSLHDSALDLLIGWQKATLSGPAPALVSGRRMDATLLRWELDHYVEWRLRADLGVELSAAEEATLSEAFDRWVAEITAMPEVVIHRDWQSRNLMLRPDGELVIIDFQDAMMGPYIYDLVAMLRDSYIGLSPARFTELVQRFAAGRRQLGMVESAAGIEHDVGLMSLQRKLKDAGRFVQIDRERGNPSFLKFIPLSMEHVAVALKGTGGEDKIVELLLRYDPDFISAWESL